MCSAVFYVHTDYRLTHSDIKPDNLVFNDSYQLALIDLGHTQKFDATISHDTGTRNYRPLEIESGNAYKVAPADIYGLATTILVIMFQDLAFGKVNQETFNSIYANSGTKERFFTILYKSFREGVDERHPEDILELLFRCLNPVPEMRPTIFEFMQCAWIVDAPEALDEMLTQELSYLMTILEPHPHDQ